MARHDQLLAALLCLAVSSCGSGQYDDQREWRLRECEKILDTSDRAACLRATPHYTR
ncbi:hypothetical protein [Spongiibacter sp.]|uniref:hypothetical protein n=1 Tax=Spongiibacter sp. TaxID=2024860 RepID=UPI00356559BA